MTIATPGYGATTKSGSQQLGLLHSRETALAVDEIRPVIPFREYYCNPGLPRERSVLTSSPWLRLGHTHQKRACCAWILEALTPGGPLRTNNEAPTPTGSKIGPTPSSSPFEHPPS